MSPCERRRWLHVVRLLGTFGVLFTSIVVALGAEGSPVPGLLSPGVDPVSFTLVLSIFSAVGHGGRLVAEMKTYRSRWQMLGDLVVSVFVADIVALILWDVFSARPPVLAGLAAAISWGGGPVLDRIGVIAMRQVESTIGRDDPK